MLAGTRLSTGKNEVHKNRSEKRLWTELIVVPSAFIGNLGRRLLQITNFKSALRTYEHSNGLTDRRAREVYRIHSFSVRPSRARSPRDPHKRVALSPRRASSIEPAWPPAC